MWLDLVGGQPKERPRMGNTKNVTLAIDEALLEKARIVAIRRHTSVNDLIRQHLEELVRSSDESRAARERLAALMSEPSIEIGAKTWNRDELHDR